MNLSLKEQEAMPVHKAVLMNAIPAMLGMIMILIYNMADLFFIGQTGDDLKVAAVSMATPMFLIFMSLGNIFGVGGASLLSRNLGSGEEEAISGIASFCFWSCILIGGITSVVTYVFAEPLVTILGASDETMDMVMEYLRYISVSGVAILLSNCLSALVRAEGKPEKAMIGMMLGNIINIALDPILILMMNMGVAGAGLATAIGNICGCAYYIWYLLKAQTLLSWKPADFTTSNGIPKAIFLIGIPASLSSVLMSVSQMLINGQMSQYGDLAVAGIGVALKVTMLTTMVCIGIGMGVQPLLGYTIGSNNKKKYNEIYKFSIVFAVCLSGILTILCYLLLTPIINGFVSDPDAFSYAYDFSQILISTSVITSVLFVMAYALQSAGAVTASLIINISKNGIIYIPLLFILGSVFGMKGLVYTAPIADVFTFIIAIILYKKSSEKFFKD